MCVVVGHGEDKKNAKPESRMCRRFYISDLIWVFLLEKKVSCLKGRNMRCNVFYAGILGTVSFRRTFELTRKA